MVMGDVEAAIDLMLQLRSLGCKLSLDDFGTGYSSLSYLRRFPIDTLKVDQSFVRNMNSAEDFAIVRTIVNLAHTLAMDVIAEGVETAEDVEALRSLGPNLARDTTGPSLYPWMTQLPFSRNILTTGLSLNCAHLALKPIGWSTWLWTIPFDAS